MAGVSKHILSSSCQAPRSDILLNIYGSPVLLYTYYDLLWDVGFTIIQKRRLGERNSCAPHNWLGLPPTSMLFPALSCHLLAAQKRHTVGQGDAFLLNVGNPRRCLCLQNLRPFQISRGLGLLEWRKGKGQTKSSPTECSEELRVKDL